MKNNLLPVAALLLAGACVILAEGLSVGARVAALGAGLPWCALLVTLAFVAAGAWRIRNANARFTRAHAFGLATALAFAAAAPRVVQPRFRVQWDETSLFSASLAQRYGGTALVPTMALPSARGPVPFGFTLERRPPGFAFLTGLAHALLGPSSSNPFVVNGLVLAALLFTAFAVALPHGWLAGLAAQLLVLASPLTLWLAESGACDLLAAVLSLGMVLAARAQARDPEPSRLALFLAAGTSAAYVRYDSALAFLACAAAVFAFSPPRDRGARALLVAAALALVPVAMLARLNAPSFLEARGGPVFGVVALAGNLGALARAFFLPAMPYNGLLHLAAIAAIGVAIVRKKLGRRALVVALPAASVLLTSLCFFDGSPVGPQSARLYAFPLLLVSLAPLVALRLLPARAVLAGAALLCAIGVGLAARLDVLPPTEEAILAEQWDSRLGSLSENDRLGTLFVSDESFFFVSRNFAAVTPAAFLELQGALKAPLARGEIRQVIWARARADSSFLDAPAAREKLEKAFAWERLRPLDGPVPGEFFRLRL